VWIRTKRKWVKSQNTAGYIPIYGASSALDCRTFDQAMKIARKVPSGEVIITQMYWKKGYRYSRDYIYRKQV